MVSKNALMALAFTYIITFSSCSNEPVYFLKEMDKYLPIMADVYLLQVAVEQAPDIMRDSLANAYRKQLATVHQLDENEISFFLEDLAQHPLEAQIFYDSLAAFLEAKDYEYNRTEEQR